MSFLNIHINVRYSSANDSQIYLLCNIRYYNFVMLIMDIKLTKAQENVFYKNKNKKNLLKTLTKHFPNKTNKIMTGCCNR